MEREWDYKIVRSNLGILIGLLIMCIGLTFISDSFATSTNIFNVLRQISVNVFLACGMTMVILIGGIDLSVGSVIAISGCLCAGFDYNNGIRQAWHYFGNYNRNLSGSS